MKVPGFATRTGVFTYIDANGKVRRELRHPDDVFDPESLATLKNAPVTLEHPPIMLTPANVKQYSKGWTTDRVEVNRDLVDTDLIIAVDDAINAVERDGMRELSSGYTADLEETPGVYNGTPYDVRQRNIKYNHLAIVKKGRAGPEARLRLDSADAVMQDEVPNQTAAQFQPEGENDSEGGETKTIVISGQKVDLPSGVADIIQDMMDRYDQMRGDVAKLKEGKEDSMAKRKDGYGMKDVDINQKNVSPDVNVVQMAPDGRGASRKIDGEPQMSPGVKQAKGLDEDENGVTGGSKPNSYEGGSKALQDRMKDGEEAAVDAEQSAMPPQQDGDAPAQQPMGMGPKQDYEGAGDVGAAMSPADRLKHEIQEMEAQLSGMKDKYDAMQAKVDEFASQSMGQGETAQGGQKMDSANWRAAVSRRVKLEKRAEKILPPSLVSHFDSLSDHEIMATVIKHVRPQADLRGKSRTYLETRFDTIAEDLERGEVVRREMGSRFLESSHMDSVAEHNPNQARKNMLNTSRNEWQSPLSAVKK